MPAQVPETLEEALAAIQALEKRTESLESESTKLKATNQGLLKDLKKKKTVDSFLKVAGIELSDDLDEDAIAERIAGLRKREDSDDNQPEPQVQSQQTAQGQTPADAMNEAMKAQFASLRKELTDLRKTNEQLENERNQEREKRRESKLERFVTDELSKAECRRPSHLYKLMKEKFRLLDDESTVVFGSEDDPVSLRDAVTKLRDDEEFAVYFAGSGATGSGMTTTRAATTTYSNNPFSKDSVNATKAAELLQKDPDKAKRLMNEARLAGKLDPVLGRAVQSM
jgi:predicted RNase H-like HicB family nuclease